MKALSTPISDEAVNCLDVGDMITLSGYILTGRDAVLPKLVRSVRENKLTELGITLQGGVIFHTAVSPAGVGPTSSNKLEIETSIPELSRAGVKLHLGKGALSKATIESLRQYNSAFGIVPPTTALLESRIRERTVVAFPEEGMEALHQLWVVDFPIIVAAIHGRTLSDNITSEG